MNNTLYLRRRNVWNETFLPSQKESIIHLTFQNCNLIYFINAFYRLSFKTCSLLVFSILWIFNRVFYFIQILVLYWFQNGYVSRGLSKVCDINHSRVVEARLHPRFLEYGYHLHLWRYQRSPVGGASSEFSTSPRTLRKIGILSRFRETSHLWFHDPVRYNVFVTSSVVLSMTLKEDIGVRWI